MAMDRILAFKDPVLCDSFAAETMGYRPEEIEYIRLASELGVGSMDTASARIRPVRPEGGKSGKGCAPGPGGSAGKICGAEGSLLRLLWLSDLRPGPSGPERAAERQSGKKYCVGQGFRGKSGALGIGNCTRCFEKNLRGCPPKAVNVVKFLEENW